MATRGRKPKHRDLELLDGGRAWFRRDGRQWVVWCPAIDVMTQARTKKEALEALREAVELWFESCIERGVLDTALKEVGWL